MSEPHPGEQASGDAAAARAAVSAASRRRRDGVVVVSCVLFVAAMVGAAYAAVPLYQLFCKVTGFGGTTQVATAAPSTTSEREIEVRFDANVAPGVPWRFVPEQRSVKVKLGETKLIFYKVENTGSKTVTAAASYNVTPEQSGYYFAKMQCFCFTDQTLKPGESLDMPVVFFVDPSLADDPDAKAVSSITLSYTFFAKPDPVAAAQPKAAVEKSPL